MSLDEFEEKFDEYRIAEIEKLLIQGMLGCRTTEAVEAAITYSNYISTIGLTPENYPIFLKILEIDNHWVIDELIGDKDPFLLLSPVPPNKYILKRTFSMLTKWNKEGIYSKNLSVILGLIQSVYSSPKSGYQIYPVSIADVNALSKHLNKGRGQNDPLNRIILNILEKFSGLEDYENDGIEEIAIHASEIRSAFFDDKKKLKDVLPPVLIKKVSDRQEVPPRKRIPVKIDLKEPDISEEDIIVIDLESELDGQKQQNEKETDLIEEKQIMIEDINKAVEALTKELESQKEIHKKMEVRITEMQDQYDKDLKQIQTEHIKEISNIQAELNAENALLKKKLAKLKDKEKDTEKLTKELESQKEIHKKMEAKITEIRNQHDKELKKIKNKHKEQLSSIQAELNAENALLKKKLAKLKDKEKDTEKLTKELESQKEIHKKMEAKITEMQDQHDKDLKQIQTEHIGEISNIQAELNAENALLKKKLAKLRDKEKDNEKLTKELESQKEIHKKMEARITEMQDQHDENLKQIQTEHIGEISNIQAELNAENALLKKKLAKLRDKEKDNEKLTKELESQKEIHKKMEARITEMTTEMQALKSQHIDELNTSNENHKKELIKVKNYQERIYKAAMKKYIDQLIKMRSEIEKDRQDNEKTRKQLESEFLELSKQKASNKDKKKYKNKMDVFDYKIKKDFKKKPSERIAFKINQDFLELPPKDE